MYGLPEGVDLSFFIGSDLLQVCVGANEVVLNFHPDISMMVASRMRVAQPGGTTDIVDDPRKDAGKLLSLVQSGNLAEAGRTSDGALRLEWESGAWLEVDDQWEHYESYTIQHGDSRIVV